MQRKIVDEQEMNEVRAFGAWVGLFGASWDLISGSGVRGTFSYVRMIDSEVEVSKNGADICLSSTICFNRSMRPLDYTLRLCDCSIQTSKLIFSVLFPLSGVKTVSLDYTVLVGEFPSSVFTYSAKNESIRERTSIRSLYLLSAHQCLLNLCLRVADDCSRVAHDGPSGFSVSKSFWGQFSKW